MIPLFPSQSEMAAVPQTGRKLSVVDTLDHARRALSTHRRWLKRQVSSEKFGTGEEDEKKTNMACTPQEMGEEEAKGGEGSPTRAPPTLLPLSQGPVHTVQTAREWIEFLQQKRITAKVAPSPVLESLEEEDEDQRGEGEGEVLSRKHAWSAKESSLREEEAGSGHEEHVQKDKSHRPHSKLRWMSKASVLPSPSPPGGHKDSPSTTKVPVHLFTSPSPSLPPPPLPVAAPVSSVITAWGSLSSLDNYMESLQEHRQTKTQGEPPLLPSVSPSNTDGSDHETSPHQPTAVAHSPPPSHEKEASPSISSDTDTVHNVQQLQISGLATPTSSPEPVDTDPIDIEAIRSESRATVLPVSPAPRDQQSSYEAHLTSKLEQAESGLRVVGVEEGHTTLPEATEDIRLMSPKKSVGGRNKTPQSVPEPLFQAVLPVGMTQRSSGSGSVVAVHASSKPSQPGQAEMIDTNSSPLPSSPDVASPHVAEKNQSVVENPLHSAGEGVGGGGGGGGGRGGGRGGREGGYFSFHPQITSTPTPPSGDGALRNGPEAGGRNVLEELELPALKPNVTVGGGRSILSGLPRLKPQTSPAQPSSPGTDLKLSSKRSHDPPLYPTDHLTGRMALNPPCPRYGVVQPANADVSPLHRKRVYSEPSPSITPSPPTSPLSPHKGSPLQSNTRRVSANVIPGGQDHTDTAIPPPQNISPSPTRKKMATGSPGSSRPRPKLQKTNSVPAHIQTGKEGGGGGGGGGGGLPESPLIQKHRADGTRERRSSSLSIYQMPTGPGPLHLAAKSGNLRRLQSLIAAGNDIDPPDHEGRTPLMYCIHSKGVHLSCADLLIREGANVNKQTSDGSTAIHLASAVGAVSLIELMLLNEANPDIRDFEGRLPLHWATLPQSTKCATLLLRHSNMDINTVDDAGMTALMWAAYNNNPILIAFLLSQGADCEEKDMDGLTAMHWAVHREGTKCLQLLLTPDRTYFKDHKGRTVLHHVAEAGSIASGELVLSLRADAVHDLDRMGRTPLHYAAACSRVDVCALLLDRGSDASQKDLSGNTAVEYARKKKLDYVVALLTCHSTAVADFARASRTTSVSSLLNRATSFSQLPVSRESPCNQDIITESMQALPAEQTAAAKEERSSCSFGSSDGVYDPSLVHDGAFLGRFVQDRKDPLQHFLFWLTPDDSSIHWSREKDKRKEQKARVFEVHEGPSTHLKQNPAYSPQELHTHVFWVATDIGVLDLLAYNEEAYAVWVRELRKAAQGIPKVGSHDKLGNTNTVKRLLGSGRAGGRALVVENEAHDAERTPAPARGWTDNSTVLRPPHNESTVSELELRTSPENSSSGPSAAASTHGTVSEMPRTAQEDSPFIDDII